MPSFTGYNNVATGTGTTVTLALPVLLGDVVVVIFVNGSTNALPAITDNLNGGQTWTSLTTTNAVTRFFFAWAQANATGTMTVTMTTASNSNERSITGIVATPGAAESFPVPAFDQSSALTTDNSDPFQITTGTPATANEFIIGAWAWKNTAGAVPVAAAIAPDVLPTNAQVGSFNTVGARAALTYRVVAASTAVTLGTSGATAGGVCRQTYYAFKYTPAPGGGRVVGNAPHSVIGSGVVGSGGPLGL